MLVNNAGFGLLGAVEESSDADVRHMYDTNVFGLLNVTRAVLPAMRARRAGHVINISSIGGFRSGAGFGVYLSLIHILDALEVQTVLVGEAIGQLGSFSAVPHIRAGRLVPLLLRHVVYLEGIYLYYGRRTEQPLRVRTFCLLYTSRCV